MTEVPSLAQHRWPVLDGSRPLLLVPVGSTEQHGPALPLGADTMIATSVTQEVARRLVDDGRHVLVAPAVGYGASGEHEGFPGTISIGREALGLMLVELGRSACRWAGDLVFVNGHGGNALPVRTAVEQLRGEGRPVSWTDCSVPGADAHAGLTETSLLQFLAPWTVRVDLLAPGTTTPIQELMPALRADGVRAVSGSGVLGDPTGASAEEGRRLLEQIVNRVVREIAGDGVGPDGRLDAGERRAVTG